MNGRLVGVAAVVLAIAACGTREPDRTTGGAAAGAATGAGVGALGGPVGALAGAAIGAGAGAVTGAVTSPSDVNLGRPLWSDPEVRTPLSDDRRGGRTARRNRDRDTAQTAQNRREPRNERDRAYMGGGMVGGDSRTGATGNTAAPAATGSGNAATGGTGGSGGTTRGGTGGEVR
jgi:hypothetical protein